MWKCPKCGLYIPSNESRCLDCGFKLPKDKEQRKAILDPPKEVKHKTSKKPKISTIILALLVIYLFYRLYGLTDEYNEVVEAYNNLQDELESTQAERESLEEEVVSLKTDLEMTRTELRAYQGSDDADSEPESTSTYSPLPDKNNAQSEAYRKGEEVANKINDFLSGRSTSESSTPTEDEYKSYCTTLDYNDILRNPDSYNGKYATISGKVDQIIEGWLGSYTIYILDNNGNKWGCTYHYADGESHLLEDDRVTLCGECKGTDTSETVLGKQITLLRVDLEYIN